VITVNMRTRLISLVLILLIAAPALALAQTATQRNAVLMISDGEKTQCTFGNVATLWIVVVHTSTLGSVKRYWGDAQHCALLPIRAKVGATVSIIGILQDTDAIPGGAHPSIQAPAQAPVLNVQENCFNVEAFSIGLAANEGSQFDPQDPSNSVNGDGYGLAWFNSDNSLKPGPFSYTVAGCNGQPCPITTQYFNTDNVPTSCALLAPIY
jgi:hypothetical protein